MKRPILAASVAFFSSVTCIAAPVWNLYKGTAIVKPRVDYASEAACIAGARGFPNGKYTCRALIIVPVDVPASAPPPAPPASTPPPAPPASSPIDMHAGMHVDQSSIPAPVAGVKSERVSTTGQLPTPSDIGQFRTVCYLAQTKYDDPIVFPEQPAKSHLHAFYGNDSMDAFSTVESMKLGGSTCRGGTVNLSSYWSPPFIDSATSKVVPAAALIVYYKDGYLLPSGHFSAFPEGLKMIAGNPTAKTAAENGAAFFTCVDPVTSTGPHTATIPACPAGSTIWASVNFPQCWDGKNLDSPDHRSHMGYPVQLQQAPFTWSCPSTHPVALPALVMNFQYPVRAGDDTTKWRVASDTDPAIPGGTTFHADYIALWKKEIIDTWIAKCNNAVKDCAAHMLGDGRVMDSFGSN